MQHQIFLAGGPLGSSHLAKGWSPTIRSIQDIRDISIWLDQLTNNPPIFSQPPSPWISQDSSACWTAWSWESPEARRWILDEQVQRIFLHKPSGNGDWTIKKLWFYPLIWKIWTFFRMLSLFHCIWSSVQHCTNLQQFFLNQDIQHVCRNPMEVLWLSHVVPGFASKSSEAVGNSVPALQNGSFLKGKTMVTW